MIGVVGEMHVCEFLIQCRLNVGQGIVIDCIVGDCMKFIGACGAGA